MSAPAPVLQLRDLVRRFGGIAAIQGISLTVQPGEVVGIMGPNGSGKSTLFNLITGLYAPNSGEVVIDGVDATGLPPYAVARLGVVRTFQNPRVFSRLGALEHAVVGDRKGVSEAGLMTVFRHLVKPWTEGSASAARTVERVFEGRASAGPAAAQPYGIKRLLEIARCLASSPRLLLLDEPTAGLIDAETARLCDVLRRVAREDGLTIMVIAHDIEFLERLCARIVVIDRGRCIADGTPGVIGNHSAVFDAYFGGRAH